MSFDSDTVVPPPPPLPTSQMTLVPSFDDTAKVGSGMTPPATANIDEAPAGKDEGTKEITVEDATGGDEKPSSVVDSNDSSQSLLKALAFQVDPTDGPTPGPTPAPTPIAVSSSPKRKVSKRVEDSLPTLAEDEELKEPSPMATTADEEDDYFFDQTELMIPPVLDVTKICDAKLQQQQRQSTKKDVTKYQLVGGILYDQDDDSYVAVVRNLQVVDPFDDEAWMLLEREEVIPMSEPDVLEFLKGNGNGNGDDEGNGDEGGEEDGESSPCATCVVYKRQNETCQKELDQLLSDIIISQVSGKLDSRSDYYYYEEEEIIE